MRTEYLCFLYFTNDFLVEYVYVVLPRFFINKSLTCLGQERFTWMTRVYYKDAHGCVIMFDLSNKNSFINTLKWKKDVEAKCTQSDGSPIPCMLLGNKVS